MIAGATGRRLRWAAGVLAMASAIGAGSARDASPQSATDSLAGAIHAARDLFLAGRHAEAWAAAESLLAVAVRREGLESGNAYTARELLVEVRLLGQYRPDAEVCALARRTLEYRLRTAAPDSTNLLRSLQLVARCLQRSGRLAEGLEHQRRAIAIEERARGPDSYLLSVLLNALAGILGDLGRHGEMRDALERALAIRLRHRPPDDATVVLLRNNLAVACEAAGDYAAALPLFEEVLARYEVLHGGTDGKTGYALNNLANVLAVTGDRTRARMLYERALSIRERGTGATFEIAETLTNLGHLLLEDGEPNRARELLERALTVATETLRPDHPHRVQALLGLAAVGRAVGALDEARRRAGEALAAVEAGSQPDGADAGRALVSQGETALAAGDPAAAEAPLTRAVRILGAALGEEHPRVGGARRLLAEAFTRTGDPRALGEALASERIAREHQRHTFRVLPERRALAMRVRADGALDLALACLEDARMGEARADPGGAPGDSGVAAVWDALIRSRGLVLDEMASRIHREHDADSTAAALARLLGAARRRQANLAVRGPRGEEEAAYRGRLEDARRSADAAEAALARRSAHFRAELTRGRVGLSDVMAALPRGAALIAFVRFEPLAGAPRYAAFVSGGRATSPAFVPLGAAREIDSLVAVWRAAAGRRRRDTVGAEESYRRVASALRRRVWDPLAARIGPARDAVVVPDGALGVLNFAALPLGTDAYLVEHGPTFHYLTAERALVPRERARPSGGQLIAVGGVDYDTDTDRGGRPPAARAPAPAARPAGAVGDCEDLGSRRFERLPQSLREVEDTRARWAGAGPTRNARVLTGGEATESVLRSLAPRATVLHLATHGFFLPDTCHAGSAAPGAGDKDPLERSGLALAGANARLRGAVAGDDGILTAAEVAALELGATDWVVLSGCETGLGVPAALEGLLGLRRAFEVAGAGTLVTSLWSVEDAPARRWVGELYDARLGRGRAAAEGAREASRALLETQRRNGRGGHPAAWGAFIAYGMR